jgi:hypothetical protein
MKIGRKYRKKAVINSSNMGGMRDPANENR